MRASHVAVAGAPPPSNSDQALRDRQRHTIALKQRFARSGRREWSVRCPSCGSRVDITSTYYPSGAPKASTGQCRTANCISWAE